MARHSPHGAKCSYQILIAFKVLRQLIFVYETYITVSQDPSEFFSTFGKPSTCMERLRVFSNPVCGSLLDALTCLSAIFKAKKELVLVFRVERSTSQKLDICRAAALYLAVRYQFDVDLVVRTSPLQRYDAGRRCLHAIHCERAKRWSHEGNLGQHG
jgi:hypothetical protein